MTSLRFGTEPTPVGTAVIAVGDAGLIALELGEAPPEHTLEPVMRHLGAVAMHDPAAVEHVAAQLREYFAGERTAFDVAIDWSLTRGFPRAALEAICDIPYGETAAYGEIAITAGSPGAARAVGTACATTPISLVVPVHRVVRSDGAIGRYGRHPEAKRFLIDLERENARAGV
ncbi:MAG: methylated-DNA--[protein]-cysteine S-methyltransferase [Gemmatimonadota bacterium]|nr:methylated-DNA--[protein]-cysteine S-methyltransferase [Gemmatimonadota bacterium]